MLGCMIFRECHPEPGELDHEQHDCDLFIVCDLHPFVVAAKQPMNLQLCGQFPSGKSPNCIVVRVGHCHWQWPWVRAAVTGMTANDTGLQ